MTVNAVKRHCTHAKVTKIKMTEGTGDHGYLGQREFQWWKEVVQVLKKPIRQLLMKLVNTFRRAQ